MEARRPESLAVPGSDETGGGDLWRAARRLFPGPKRAKKKAETEEGRGASLGVPELADGPWGRDEH